jgi:hypothetical protein
MIVQRSFSTLAQRTLLAKMNLGLIIFLKRVIMSKEKEDNEVYCGDCLVPLSQCGHKP